MSGLTLRQKAAIRYAVMKTLKEQGLASLKATSLFASNDPRPS